MFRKVFRMFIVSREPALLGRWTITDMKQNKIKIDWANVDHCGTCSYDKPKKKEDVSKPTKPKTK